MSVNKKILVVEDDEAISKALQTKLVNEGYEVIVATDGAEGVELALSEKPDLILLDVILPVMDGITVWIN